MSIEDVIVDHVKRGMLRPLLPRAPGAQVDRAMFLSDTLWRSIFEHEGGDDWQARTGKLMADLERFLSTEDPIEPKYLFLLYPLRDGVWEIRSVRDDPSIRILGCFAAKDVFIATTFALREELGSWESREWKRVKRKAAAEWRRLFPTYPPMREHSIHKVVTGALSGEYFRDPQR